MSKTNYLILASFIFLLSCSDAAKEASEIKVFSIDITVTGLEDGESIQIIESESGKTKTITENNLHTLPNFNLGDTYSIAVTTNLIDKRCVVNNGTGLIDGPPGNNVTIRCLKLLSISGKLTGLKSGRLILRLKSGGKSEDIELTESETPTAFNFNLLSLDTEPYEVTILSYPKPPYQRCAITNGTGTLNHNNISGVAVQCQLTIFISGNDGIVGEELFVSDGTTDGTFLLKDINTNSSSNPENFVAMNGATYFVATDGINGQELWKTNGTLNGTELVKDINPNPGEGSFSSNFSNPLIVFNNNLYFTANDGNLISLWKSDGTATGTVILKSFGQNIFNRPESFTISGNLLYFNAESQLWISDGTVNGTESISSTLSRPNYLTAVGNVLFFNANGITGVELYMSDGTPTGTVLVKDINPGNFDSYPLSLTAMDNILYFSADDGTNNRELWRSDGTPTGTWLVKDINPTPGSSSISFIPHYPFEVIGNTLFFAANDGTNGEELWKSDGTANNTTLVKNINIDGASLPRSLTAFGNKLYFSADDGTNGIELWTSDGTPTGTILVKDINSESSNPDALTISGNKLYFTANDGVNGKELWTSDGTTDGTKLVKDINPGLGDSIPAGFNELNGTVYFAAHNGTNGNELWRSDGTGGFQASCRQKLYYAALFSSATLCFVSGLR